MEEIDISVNVSCPDCRPIILEFWKELKKELTSILPENFVFEVSIDSDETVKELNKQYRNKDSITDVLSFEDGEILPDGKVFLGSIIIAYERAKQQAKEIGNSFEEELRFLFMHGILHILGYDHETDNGEMFALQKKLKKKLEKFFPKTED